MYKVSTEEQPMITVEGLYKSFKLPHEQHSGIKQAIINFAKQKKGFEVQHVLDDVSFEIKKGEFFGIVGRNGSGKSTLLKLMAGIYSPDRGVVQVNGSLTPFIELGVGFNPELTGRENVFMNGALLGFSNDEMGAMYDDIVKFAELERFMDQKLKNYSSGMQVRLAFSIAVRAKSDILLVDEVLAVGDSAFQEKCFSYFRTLKKEGRTVVFISHDMDAVKSFCDRAILVKNGRIVAEGIPQNIAMKYAQENQSSASQGSDQKENSLIRSITLAQRMNILKCGEKVEILINIQSDVEIEEALIGVSILTESGYYVGGFNTSLEKPHMIIPKGESVYSCMVDTAQFSRGRFRVGAAVMQKTKVILDSTTEGPIFVVTDTPLDRDGLVNLQANWK